MGAEPNSDRYINVLVVDPNREIWERVCNVLATEQSSRWNRFRPKLVAQAGHARDRIERGKTPDYAAVFYAPGSIKGEAKTIGSIQRRAPLMVQVLVEGRSRFEEKYKRFANANGAHEVAETTDGLVEITRRHFYVASPLQNTCVIKAGGSAIDYQMAMLAEDQALQIYADAAKEIFRERVDQQRHKMIWTPGAGARGDIAKAERSAFPNNQRVQEDFPNKMLHALLENAGTMYNLFTNGPDRAAASLRDPRKFYLINRNHARKKVQIAATAPPYIMVRDGIPIEDSDTHTIALAEFYQAQRVVIIKRTDGIYRFDPLRGFELGPEGPKDLARWQEIQKENERYAKVTVDQLLDGISREGTDIYGESDGTIGHLLEDSALHYFAHCQHVKEILIVHVAPHELYFPTSSGLQHIVTGETTEVTDWNAQRAHLLREAVVNGNAYSKITRKE
jgi:uridylate kinase